MDEAEKDALVKQMMDAHDRLKAAGGVPVVVEGRCKTCRWWFRRYHAHRDSVDSPWELRAGRFGRCRGSGYTDHLRPVPVYESAGGLVGDTAEDYGCVHHDPSPKGESERRLHRIMHSSLYETGLTIDGVPISGPGEIQE